MKDDFVFPAEQWNFGTQDMLYTLTSEEYEFLIGQQRVNKYKRGELIFREGHIPSGLFFILSGKVKKYTVSGDGREKIIYVASDKEFIGYHALLAEERYPDSAAALDHAQICFIPKEDFYKILNQSSRFNSKLIKTLSHEFGVLSNNLSISYQKSGAERLAIALLMLNGKYNLDPASSLCPITLSRKDLANIVGLAQENIIRLLKELKAEGAIRTQGKEIWIDNMSLLAKRTNYL